MPEDNKRFKPEKGRFSTASFLIGVACTAAIGFLVFSIWYTLPVRRSITNPASLEAMKKVSETENILRKKYIEEIDESGQTDAMIAGLVSGLGDKYAAYYTEQDYEDMKRKHAGLTKGIGITVAQDPESGDPMVVSVIEDSPAAEAGVEEGDRILAVNGADMTGLDGTEVSAAVQESGDSVTLTILREGEEKPFELSMVKAEIETVAAAGIMLSDQIGYICISTFNDLTSSQFAEAYAALQEEGMQAMILDLRNNLGGLVTACVDTGNQILPKGVIVYEKERDKAETHQDSSGETPIDIPLVVLVNRYTASASEILTGAIRDYGIATIVGEQTYGKGVEQKTYNLSDGSAVKLTTTSYYTPNHESIDGVGITPDVVVEFTEKDTTDVQLEKALELLKGKL
ncbi:MAG: S41 family peptidase [Eubacterium sp.]|nr:S41 family peptidase [Eubacterium sp.]